jgi:putative membrane protein
MKTLYRSLLVASAAFASVCSAADHSGLSHGDRTFFEKAAKSGAEEVAISQAALARLQNPQAKAFAQMMVSDHTSANEELRALAARKNVALPAKQPNTKKWSEGKERDYDEDYIEKMVKDHEDAVELFTKAAKKSDDPEVQAFAARTLPTLQQHWDQAKALKKALK